MSPPAKERIFVSHSHKDNTYCRAFVEALRTRHGFDVWYDEHDMRWGQLRATIAREMPKCQHFVAIFSPNSVGAPWVNREIDTAIGLNDKGVLRTIHFVTATPCEVPLLLDTYLRIEGPDGAGVPPDEAAEHVARRIAEKRDDMGAPQGNNEN